MVLLCHIVGLNNTIKNKFYNDIKSIDKDIVIKDLDEMSEEFINNSITKNLNKKLQDEIDKKNNSKAIKNINIVNKNISNIKKQIEDNWLDFISNNLSNILNFYSNKIVILTGMSHYIKNHSVKIEIDTPNKIFVDIDVEINAKQIVEYNLKKYIKEIINGSYPLKYIDHEFLKKQRIDMTNIYSKLNYVLRSPSFIISLIRKLIKSYKDNPSNIQKNNNIIKTSKTKVVDIQNNKKSNSSIPINILNKSQQKGGMVNLKEHLANANINIFQKLNETNPKKVKEQPINKVSKEQKNNKQKIYYASINKYEDKVILDDNSFPKISNKVSRKDQIKNILDSAPIVSNNFFSNKIDALLNTYPENNYNFNQNKNTLDLKNANYSNLHKFAYLYELDKNNNIIKRSYVPDILNEIKKESNIELLNLVKTKK